MTVRARAHAAVSVDRMVDLTSLLVNVASPTGSEINLVRIITRHLTRLGLKSATQLVAPQAANVWGSVGNGNGPSVMLYSPIDTVTTGNGSEDVPWSAATLRRDMRARASRKNGWVVGLGAHNPKGHAACVLMAIEALSAAGFDDEFAGQVLAGFGCLGMPANRRAPEQADGHGAGRAALVSRLEPDAAGIAKSGWAVSWAEVGLMWCTVEVVGTHTYVGSRHLLPYRNAIADAAHLISHLEGWFPTWASTQADDLQTPQGIVGSIDGGLARSTSFTPHLCSFTVDLRIVPGVDIDQAERIFTAEVEKAAAEIGANVNVVRTIAIPGTTTDPSEPIISAAISAWESQSTTPHQPIRGLSGATDANILRSHGVPTARVGLPKVSADGVDVDFQFGMNAVNPDDQVKLSRQLIDTALNFLESQS